MSVSYSLIDKQVRQTITIPAKEEVKELGEKTKVVKEIEMEIVKCEEIISIYTAQKTALQAKLVAIKAL